MLFTSTMIAYIILIILLCGGTAVDCIMLFSDRINTLEFMLIALVIIFIFTFLGILLNKNASKRYNATLVKLNNDLQGFFKEQNDFIKRPFLNKTCIRILKNNMAAAYTLNEQYTDALNMYLSFENEINSETFPQNKIIFFLNIATLYMHLGNGNFAKQYINNAYTAYQELSRKYSSKPDIVNWYKIMIEAMAAQCNFMANRNSQTAQELYNCCKNRISPQNAKGAINYTSTHYIMAVCCTEIGNNSEANEHFNYVIQNGGDLPCVNRSKKYLETGDTSLLKI